MNNIKPKITVLMPVYNAENFLAESIESITGQTFTDFEFLIIDDGSTDNSISIIKSYDDPRIRFYRNEKNIGISATLNKGIKLSTTDYIARMDADDVSYPERLSKQYGYMLANADCAMVSCLVKVINQEGEFIREDKFKSEYFYYNLTFICWIYHPTVMYRKKEVMSVGMYTATYSEDFELFWQLSRKYKFYNLPEVLLDYRITKQSLHQVLKKKEYEQAQRGQLLRNFRYYAGNNYNISANCIECMQHNFAPLHSENSIGKIMDCIKQLEFLTKHILLKDNVNRDAEQIKKAAFYKKKFIVTYFIKNFSLPKKIMLLIRLGEFNSLYKLLKV